MALRAAQEVPRGTTGDIDVLLLETSRLWRDARADGREYLSWAEWSRWAKAALRAGLVTRDELTDPPERFSGGLWRVSVLKTWRRVKRARSEGISAEQFHRDEIAAAKQELQSISLYSAGTARRRV